MNFFCTKKHYEAWEATHPREPATTYLLDLEEAIAVARRLFGPAP